MSSIPHKPKRASTIKLVQRPEYLQQVLPGHDVNPPKLHLNSLFDVDTYPCDQIIKHAEKSLDRHALLETSRSLRIPIGHTGCCERCWRLSIEPGLYLAKYLTYEDLKLLKANHDHGLGIHTGLELLTLPQGIFLRHDVVERYESCSLFFALQLVLCQNLDDRLELTIRLLDCAMHLFDTFGNLFGFGYVMASFELPEVARLDETWRNLSQTNVSKSNLMENLKQRYTFLVQEGMFEAEKTALVPNIYPLAALLSSPKINRPHSLQIQAELLLTARYIASHANRYAIRSEQFIHREYEHLYPIVLKKCPSNLLKNYAWLSQTEFHEIIMWGRKRFNTEKKCYIEHLDARKEEAKDLIKILSKKIQPE